MQPIPSKDSIIKFVVSLNGVTVYCNKPALRDLADQINWMIESDASENYECHMRLLFDEFVESTRKMNSKDKSVVYNDGLERIFESQSNDSFGFEVTLMAVENEDFRKI